jgi:hypothetical protein
MADNLNSFRALYKATFVENQENQGDVRYIFTYKIFPFDLPIIIGDF